MKRSLQVLFFSVCISTLPALAQYSPGQNVDAFTFSYEWIPAKIIEIDNSKTDAYHIEYTGGSWAGRKQWLAKDHIRQIGGNPAGAAKPTASKTQPATNGGTPGMQLVPRGPEGGTQYEFVRNPDMYKGVNTVKANQPGMAQQLQNATSTQGGKNAPPVVQVKAAYTLEEQGKYVPQPGLPPSFGVPTQLAAGSYFAPAVPPRDRFRELGSSANEPSKEFNTSALNILQHLVWTLSTKHSWHMGNIDWWTVHPNA